jgi:NAD(P)-dependent dehydrogenase (short-subunit alcohol dehydrogenase family)
MTELLTGKNAIIYGGGGSIGGAVARTFAREGATVFLAGRTRESLERVAGDIAAAGGRAEVAVLDALNERAVDEHADAVAARAGGIDVSLNLITRGDEQGTPLVDMTTQRFLHAITTGVTTAFLTARAAARHMAPRGSGVILHLTSASARGTMPLMGNTGPADAATEAFLRYLAAELGPSGVRVVGIHTAGVAGTLTREKVAAVTGDPDPQLDAMVAGLTQMTMLRRRPELEQIADTAAFLASDGAGAITSGIVNATCGLVAG